MRHTRGPVAGLALVGMVGGLGGCAKDAPTVATSPATDVARPEPAVSASIATATALWRDADPAKHPKGSCSGCHGADWFDLARIGTTDADLVRRAVLDGATAPEAQALVVAVREYRARFRLGAENARTFRPFQPGGRVLPGARGWERDIAMGEQLQRLLPTLSGPRIADLAMAKRARDEVADLLLGTNRAGANPERLHLRTLPVGVVYPRWSADVAHGADEGTLNDWVADLAFDPTPATQAEWRALVDAYLANPANETFWALYAAVPRLLVPKDSTLPIQRVIGHKFRAALIGQHMLRMEAAGRLDEFLGKGVAFAALDRGPLRQLLQANERVLTGNQLNRLPSFHLWDVGDAARGYFGGTVGERFSTNLLGRSLADERAPTFVVESVDPSRTRTTEEQALRLAWFWIGFTFDPTLQRSGPSNSTKSAEYLMQSLGRDRMFVHRVFMEASRAVAQSVLPEAQRDARSGVYGASPPVILDGYLYYQGTRIGYDRADTPPTDRQERHRQLHTTLLANLFRMNALLHLEGIANGFPPNAHTGSKYDRILSFLRSGEPELVPEDEVLLRRVATANGVTLP